MASTMKSYADFVNNYTPQLLALASAMVLLALHVYQKVFGGTETHETGGLNSQWMLFEGGYPKPKPVESSRAWWVTENILLAVFLLWILKPFADLAHALLQLLIQYSVRPKLMSSILKEDKFVAYGSCARAPAEHGKLPMQMMLAQCDLPCAPASHVQEPMLTWQYLHPQSGAFNEGWCVSLQGASVSTDALRAAFRNIVQRYPSLRSNFTLNEDSTWTQQVIPVHQIFPQIYSQVDTPGDEHRAFQLVKDAFNTPFKIFAGITARIGVVRISSSKVLIYVVQHHVGTDAVSMPLVYEALRKQYVLALDPSSKGLSGLAPPVATLDASLAECRSSMAARMDVQDSLEWWRKQTQGGIKLDLPSDYVRKSQPTFSCIHVPFQFPPELSKQIQALAQREGLTFFDILLALHSIWLCKMAGQEDLVVWTAHHCRTASSGEGAVGCFRIDMPLRLAPQGTFRQIVHLAAEVKKNGLNHLPVPTMSLLEAAGVDAQGGQNALHYYSDRYNRAGIAATAAKEPFADGVQASQVDVPRQASIPDVEVVLAKDASGYLYGHTKFNADIFSHDTAARMIECYTTMAMAAMSDSNCDFLELPLLTPRQEEVLDKFHGPHAELRSNVVELLAECMKSLHSNVAVEYEPTGEQLTYAELGARVCGLAAHLSSLGVARDVLCAIMIERSIEMVVAIYSVWWAGGAYIPIEPSASEQYLDFIVEDLKVNNGGSSDSRLPSCALTVLTQSWILERRGLQKHFSNAVSLDTFKPRLPGIHFPENGFPEPDQLCYSIYTSGSTGRPKGVLLPHKGLANHIEESRELDNVTSQDVFFQKTPYIFDVSVYEFATPLAVGAKLLVAKHEAHKDVSYVADAMRLGGVTLARFVPSVIDIFLDHLKTTGMAADMPLRGATSSGEAMHLPTCMTWLQMLPQAELHDWYGPTEATIECTGLTCTGKALRLGKSIGKPLSGCQMYVANFIERDDGGCFRRTPVGLHGELLIGGVQVARGYLNLPEKTAKAFIPNPFNDCMKDILYRTGDVVKWRSDGHIVFIGRADNQVKLNGARVELGEIESAVGKVPGVREGVVKMLKDGPGGSSRLVAYVAPASAATDEVTKYCREVLPNYMVPSACVGIDEWPRTASGKIDLKKLPVPPVYAGEADDQAESFAFLSAKIKELGLVGAMGDDEVQRSGWNSFQLMTLHTEMMRNPEKYTGEMVHQSSPKDKFDQAHDVLDSDAARVQVGVISIIGHIWLFMMFIVLLEWLVAYWEWYRAMPSASSFHLYEYPAVEKVNALGRFMGDAVFTALSGIQDMRDAKEGNTGQLFRRTLLFMGICVIFTIVDRVLLQGPFARNGWIDESWAMDTGRTCGVLNGSSFVFVRAVFIPFPLIFSMGRISWIKIFGIVEWPWICLIFSILLPALMKGLPRVSGFGDGSWINWIQATNGFICELSPYYFMYPLFLGGIRFPRPIASLKVRSSTSTCCAITVGAFAVFCCLWYWVGIVTTSEVDYINMEHVRWTSWLQKVRKVDSWPLLDQLQKTFDMWAAFLQACFLLTLTAMMPVTPSPFSLMGTRVIASYLTMPLTLALAGYYVAPCYLNTHGPWRSVCGSIGVFATLTLIVSVTTAQSVMPEGLVKWASDLGPLAKESKERGIDDKV